MKLKVKFGLNKRNYLNKISNKRILLFCTSNGKNRIVSDKMISDFLKNNSITFIDKVEPNPTDILVDNISQNINTNIDLIVSIGGGSVIDTAKIIKNAHFQGIEHITLPTTSGTGSERTHFATLWLENRKISIADKKLIPDLVIMDPTLMYNLNKENTLSTVLDAINQGFESLYNKNRTKKSICFAQKAIIYGINGLELYKTNKNKSRILFAMSSYYSGKAINITKTGICHSISYPLTLRYNIPHGLACYFSMKEVLKFNKNDKILNDFIQNNYITFNDLIQFFKTLDDIFKINNIIKQYITDNPIKYLDEMYTKERYENNIFNVTKEDLKNIINNSFTI